MTMHIKIRCGERLFKLSANMECRSKTMPVYPSQIRRWDRVKTYPKKTITITKDNTIETDFIKVC